MSEAERKSIRIIGAGFSGLTLAYYLKKRDSRLKIHFLEKEKMVGGLLQTKQTPHGIAEAAANGILDCPEFREIAAELSLEIVEASPNLRRAYFLRGKRLLPWPLGIFESIRFFFTALFSFLQNRFPREGETLEEWGFRALGLKATRYLMDPALAGIYAAPLSRLSARLVLGRFFSAKREPGAARKKGMRTVAPLQGMNELAQKLRSALEAQDVSFEFSKMGTLEEFAADSNVRTVFCGSLRDAQEFLGSKFSRSREFSELEMLPLSTTTLFFESPLPYKAFGILYPRCENRKFLGTLLNSRIFPARIAAPSETWIKAGDRLEGGLLNDILRERLELFEEDDKPLSFHFTHWARALPQYDLKLERFLNKSWPEMRQELASRRIYLHGNYLGNIGLAKILLQSKELAEELT